MGLGLLRHLGMTVLGDQLAQILALQPEWSASRSSQAMATRGELVRRGVPGQLLERRSELTSSLGCSDDQLVVSGKDATGNYSRVPFVRIANRERSPSPRQGWYLVFLFAEDGSVAYLSLNQGTMAWDGASYRPVPEQVLQRRVERARDLIGARWLAGDAVELGASSMSRAYGAGSLVAIRLSPTAMLSDDEIFGHVARLGGLLRRIYDAESKLRIPAPVDPDVEEARDASVKLARRTAPQRAGFRASAAERSAIEGMAMSQARAGLKALGATSIRDVSGSRPYDLRAELNGRPVAVEVKGTSGPGAQVLLTEGEVRFHERFDGESILVVVSGITLASHSGAPVAQEGSVQFYRDWSIQPEKLTAISYSYRTPDQHTTPG